MTLLKTNGPDGDLIVPEENDPQWQAAVLSELKVRLEILEEHVYDEGYKIHGECLTLVNGLQEYTGGG